MFSSITKTLLAVNKILPLRVITWELAGASLSVTMPTEPKRFSAFIFFCFGPTLMFNPNQRRPTFRLVST